MNAIEELEICINRINRRIQEENDAILTISAQLVSSLQHPSTNVFSIACDIEVAHKRMQTALAEIDALKRERDAYQESMHILMDCM